jgi:hypothetical protein
MKAGGRGSGAFVDAVEDVILVLRVCAAVYAQRLWEDVGGQVAGAAKAVSQDVTWGLGRRVARRVAEKGVSTTALARGERKHIHIYGGAHEGSGEAGVYVPASQFSTPSSSSMRLYAWVQDVVPVPWSRLALVIVTSALVTTAWPWWSV